MNKIHTRTKRRYRMATRINPYDAFHPKKKVNGPKTFSTEAAAHAWALQHKLKTEEYALEKAKKGKRFKVVKK